MMSMNLNTILPKIPTSLTLLKMPNLQRANMTEAIDINMTMMGLGTIIITITGTKTTALMNGGTD